MKMIIATCQIICLGTLLFLGHSLKAQSLETVFSKKNESVKAVFKAGDYLYMTSITDSLINGTRQWYGILYGMGQQEESFNRIIDWPLAVPDFPSVNIVRPPKSQDYLMSISDTKMKASKLYSLKGFKAKLLTDKLPPVDFNYLYSGEKMAYIALKLFSGSLSVYSYELGTGQLRNTGLTGSGGYIDGAVIGEKLFMSVGGHLLVSEGSPSNSRKLELKEKDSVLITRSLGIYPLGNKVVISTDMASSSNGMMVSDGTQAGTSPLRLHQEKGTKKMVLGLNGPKLAYLAKEKGKYYVYQTDGTLSGTTKMLEVPMMQHSHVRGYASFASKGLAFWNNWGHITLIEDQQGYTQQIVPGIIPGRNLNNIVAGNDRIYSQRLTFGGDSILLQVYNLGDSTFSTILTAPFIHSSHKTYSNPLIDFNSTPYLILAEEPKRAALFRPAQIYTDNSEASQKESLQLYPNPCTGFANLSWPADFKAQEMLLYSSKGQLLRTQNMASSQGQWQLDLSQLPKGLYYIRLNGEGESLTQRLMRR